MTSRYKEYDSNSFFFIGSPTIAYTLLDINTNDLTINAKRNNYLSIDKHHMHEYQRLVIRFA